MYSAHPASSSSWFFGEVLGGEVLSVFAAAATGEEESGVKA
jgi:hypothetical protein